VYKDKADVAKFLYCLSVLEKRAFLLYKRLSGKVRNPQVKYRFLFVAYDSMKHSIILEKISKSVAKRPEIKAKEYERILGEVWVMVNSLSEETRTRRAVRTSDFPKLMSRLVGLGTIIMAQTKTLLFLASEISEIYNVDTRKLTGIFELLVKDEEIDTEILINLAELVPKADENYKQRSQEMKYRNPDQWFRQIPPISQASGL
jgi:hypothetical protein